jgi:hypothetical protein
MSTSQENIASQNIPRQGSFNKMPSDITFKLRLKPRCASRNLKVIWHLIE